MNQSRLFEQIEFRESLEGIRPEHLQGFFVGWPAPPTNVTLFRVLQNSECVVLAWDNKARKVIGFINAISDKVLAVYIPLLEVLPDYQHLGIGSELVRRILQLTKTFYMTDLVCDSTLSEFYRKFGFANANAMAIRRYNHQSGPAI